MNIFATSWCPSLSAHALDDGRCVKMILESAQMLGTIFNEAGVHHPYKLSGGHANHPCTRWARETYGNTEWLFAHMNALANEYERRYDRVHASHRMTLKAFDEFTRVTTQRRAMTAPVNAARRRDLNLDFTMYPTHEAYRRYLTARWELSAPRFRLPCSLSWVRSAIGDHRA